MRMFEIKKCDIGYSWNVNNCRCEMKKVAALTENEECKKITGDVIKNDCTIQNKTITLIKKVKNCKPFIGVSILFLCITIILIGIMIYFCLRLKNTALPH